MIFENLFKQRPVELKIGDKAPDFELPAADGTPVRLSSFFGKKAVVLYFYPMDNTYFCIHESQSFRDNYELFQKAGAEVVGVSSDSPKSHVGFAAKHKLPFILLSDQKSQVRNLYQVPPTLKLIPGRTTYVIDREGIIRHVYTSQFRYDSHVKLALDIVQGSKEGSPILEQVGR